MRKWLWILACISLLVAGTYIFVSYWLIPRMAAFTLPGKWNRIPLHQPRQTVHAYFGTPSTQHPLSDEFTAGPPQKRYTLRIYYSKDSLVTSYSIRYQYKSVLLSKNSVIDTL